MKDQAIILTSGLRMTILLLAILLGIGTGRAATFTVTNTNDTGAGSLRQAIADSIAAAGPDTIVFDASFNVPRTITVASNLFINGVTTNSLTITGPGANLLTISGNNAGRVLLIQAGVSITITGLTISQGRLTGASSFGGGIWAPTNLSLTLDGVNFTGNFTGLDGGALDVDTGSVTINNCSFTNNTATRSGGAIAFYTTTASTITNSVFTGNQSQSTSLTDGTGGGGIILVGGLTGPTANVSITNSTFSGNSSTARGGAIVLQNRTSSTILRSTINGNTSPGDGGGIAARDAALTITNSTISGNTGRNGGGVFRDQGANLNAATVTYSTIASNTATAAGGGIVTGTLNVTNLGDTIVANNTDAGTGPDVSGPVTSQGFNLIKSTTGATITGTTNSNITGQDPVLSPLANNGGSVQTHMLLPGSPALDAGDPANFPTTDARGNSRPIDGDGNGTAVPDIGSFERRPGILQFSASTYTAPENIAGGAATITVTRTNGTDGSVSIQYSTSDGTATAGTDYQSANGTLTLANGVASQTFPITIINDTLFEPDETVNLMVLNPLGGATLGSPALAVLTITNDDPQPMPATVSGRVTGPDGHALRNVTITMTDSQGVVRTATASSFGLFTFTDVPTGQTYSFRVASRLFRFAVTNVQVNGDMTLSDLVGLE